jgi:hypothetical protein
MQGAASVPEGSRESMPFREPRANVRKDDFSFDYESTIGQFFSLLPFGIPLNKPRRP